MSSEDCTCAHPFSGFFGKPKNLLAPAGPNESYVLDDRMYKGTIKALSIQPSKSYPTARWSKEETLTWWKSYQPERIFQQGQWSGSPPEDLAESLYVMERLIQGIRVCVWKQQKVESVPTIIFITGHSFGVGGSFNDPAYKNYFVRLAALGKCIVVSVDTSPIGVRSFANAVNECAAVVKTVANGNVGRVPGGPVVLAGNSTGGTLALATAIQANKEGWVDLICGIYSICPMLEAVVSASKYPSMKEFDGYSLSTGYFQACVNMVKDEQTSNQTLFPLDAPEDELIGLPPTKIIAYQLDILRDMGLAMQTNLMKAGVQSSLNIISGAVHDQHLYTRHSPDVTHSSIHDLVQFSNYAVEAGIKRQQELAQRRKGSVRFNDPSVKAGSGRSLSSLNEPYVLDDRMSVATKNAIASQPSVSMSYPTARWSKEETLNWWNSYQPERISQQGQWSGSPPKILEENLYIMERLIQGIRVCVWKQQKVESVPTIIYITGHGFGVGGSFNDPAYKNYFVRLAALGKCIVVSVDTSPIGVRSFANAVNECAVVVKMVESGNVGRVPGGPVLLAGNSTGGTLALATAIQANREGWVSKISGVYCICPFVEAVVSTNKYPSMKEFDGYSLSRGYFQACVNMVKDEQTSNQTQFPLDATEEELMGLPPTKIIVYQLDMIRDMGLAIQTSLVHAGVQSSLNLISGAVHDQQLYTLHSPDVTHSSIHDLAQFSSYALEVGMKQQWQQDSASQRSNKSVPADDRLLFKSSSGSSSTRM